MEKILVLLHTETDGSLAKPARETITAALSLASGSGGLTFSIGLIGETVSLAASQVAQSGAQQVLGVSGPEWAQSRYATDAAAAEAIGRTAQATVVLAPATSRWNRVLPGVAHRLQGRADTHATGLTLTDGLLTINRWYYRQRMEAALHRSQRPWFILIDPGCFEPWQGPPGTVSMESVSVMLPETHQRTQVTGTQAPAQNAQTLRPDAELLFVAGAGWTKKQTDGQTHAKEAEQLIIDFLARTRASLGSSKSLVDLSGEGHAVLPFLTHFNQIGQTGSTPRHRKGLSACCHGEEPHTVGWRFVQERRAINLDPACGWARGKADVLYVADAFAVLARVNALLEGK